MTDAKTLKPPALLHHKPSERAYVMARDAKGNRRALFLGEHGTAAGERAYRQFLSEFYSDHPTRLPAPRNGRTNEISGRAAAPDGDGIAPADRHSSPTGPETTMMQFEFEERIAASPAVVFAAASDFANAAKRLSAVVAVEMLTMGAVGVGTRFRETRRWLGFEGSEVWEVSEFEGGRRFVLTYRRLGQQYRSQLAVAPDGGGSRVRLQFEARPRTLLGKLLSLTPWPLGGITRQIFARDLADLRQSLEAS